MPGLDLHGGGVSPGRSEALPFEQRERGRALEAGDRRDVGIGAALADRHEQRAVLGDPLSLGRVLRDDRAGRRGLGVRAVDDLDLRHGEVVLAGALHDLGFRGRHLEADDVRRADAGGIIARDRVDAAAGQPDRDCERGGCRGDPPTRDGAVRADAAHDRRRLAEDACDEGAGRRLCRINTWAYRVDPRAGERRRVGAERERSLDRVASQGGRALEQAVDELRRLGRGARGSHRQRGRALVGTPQAGREPVLTLEGHPSGQQSEEDAAERVEVGGGACLAPGRLLGRPVLGRACEDAGDRRTARRACEPREPEVGDDDPPRAVLDQHVGGGQVAVDDSPPVRVGQGGRDRPAVPAGVVPVERASGDQRVERDAFDELHDEHRLAVVLEHVVEADDVRMLEARQRRRLALEPLAQLGVLGDPRVEDLQRDVALEPFVPGAPHHTHAAATQLLEQSVATRDDRLCSLHVDLETAGQPGRLVQSRSEIVKALLHRP